MKLSVIIPCHNEEDTILPFYTTMQELNIPDVEWEFYFIDDGSTDKTFQFLSELHQSDARIKCISFSRNFGKEAAICAGLRAVTGDCCVVIDADLQHPPTTIVDMYHLWQNGYEIIEGMKEERGSESLIHTILANGFYCVISKFMGINMANSSDFKFLDRKVIDSLCQLKERNTFFRALSFWTGYKSTTITYKTGERIAGKSKWSYIALFKYAFTNLFSFSYTPLYFISIIGCIVLLIGIFLGIDALITYFKGIAVGGYPSLIIMFTLATGGIMLSLGIIGIYIAKIYDEIKGRPQYIIQKTLQ